MLLTCITLLCATLYICCIYWQIQFQQNNNFLPCSFYIFVSFLQLAYMLPMHLQCWGVTGSHFKQVRVKVCAIFRKWSWAGVWVCVGCVSHLSTLIAHRFRMEAVQSITSIVIRASQMYILRVQIPPRN